MYSHGWDIAIQFDPHSVLETTLEDNPKYLDQCLRWARAHWRGNFTVMTNESYWRSRKYWWGLYAIYMAQFQTPALLVDGSLFGLLYLGLAQSPEYQMFAYACLGLWILFTKTVKLVPHFCRYPQDLVFLPISIAFGYLHGVLNIYALFTLKKSHWGSQQLDVLETARARDEEVVPLLRSAVAQADSYTEPTPGK